MNSDQNFRWLNSIPALVALSLGGIYALGAASIIGQLQSEHLNTFQIMPLFSIDQILARGIGAVTSVAVLAFPVSLMTALGIFQFESFSSSKKKETPESSPDSQGVQFPSSWPVLFTLMAGILFIPGDYLTILLFGLISMFVTIDVVRKAMNRQGKKNWRPAAFLGGYLGFVLAATLIGSIVRPDPLPHVILDLQAGKSIRGSLVASTGANWYIAQEDGRIITVPTSNTKRSTIMYSDPKGSQSLFNKIVG
ncbi:MAG TPA: hypothetical protein VNL97_06040 [Solirubrobacterales bacterium]|nr:hypothetical protein [Solirubrobacterales bacterium]